MPSITILPLHSYLDVPVMVRLWNEACPPKFAVTPKFFEYNLLPNLDALQEGLIALVDGQPAGFVVASHLKKHPDVASLEMGWLDSLVMHPAFQRQGVGSTLLEWAEDWLRQRGCKRMRLAGSLRAFSAGLPANFGTEAFCHRHGFKVAAGDEGAWDVMRDLGDGLPIARRHSPGEEVIHPCREDEKEALMEFLQRTFPGRWMYEIQLFLASGGRTQDILVGVENGVVEGFAWVTFEDSLRPLDRYFMNPLPRPWGQLGPIGVSTRVRGQGLGGLLLQEGLLYLQRGGVRSCTIDWTGLLEFYGKYGFKPYTHYLMMMKSLE